MGEILGSPTGRKKIKRLIVIFLSGMIVMNALVLWYGRSFIAEGYGDFAAFYAAGKIVQRGQGPHLYDRETQWQVQQEFSSKVSVRHGPLPYIRPSFEALLFLPFAYLSYPWAWALWVLLNIFVLFTIPFLLRPYLTGGLLPSPHWIGPLCLSFAPIAINFMHGQDAILVLLFFTLAFSAMRKQRDLLAGIFLAFGLIKFHLVIPFILVLALRRKSRMVLGFFLCGVGLFLISVFVSGWSGVSHYPEYLWRLSQATNLGVTTPESMPNLRGLMTLFIHHGLSHSYMNWLLILIVASGVAFTAVVWRPGDDRDPMLFGAGYSLCLSVTILTSYYAYSYDLTLLLLPLMLLGDHFLEHGNTPRPLRIMFAVCSAIFLFAPVYWVFMFRFGHFYWLALVLLVLNVVILWAMRLWRESTPQPC